MTHVLLMVRKVHMAHMILVTSEGSMPCYPESGFLSMTEPSYQPVQNLLNFHCIASFAEHPRFRTQRTQAGYTNHKFRSRLIIEAFSQSRLIAMGNRLSRALTAYRAFFSLRRKKFTRLIHLLNFNFSGLSTNYACLGFPIIFLRRD